MSLFSKIRRRLSHAQIMALGFLTVIIIGTVLLMLPVSSRTGQWTPFIKALFTSVSSTCVTGLVVVDTFSYWTLFGQIVILIMIQIGGLGFISIGVVFALFFNRNIGLPVAFTFILSRRIRSDSSTAISRNPRTSL